MKIKEFIEQYNNIATASLKADFVEENVNIRNYIPYVDKMTMADKLVKMSSLDSEGRNIRYNSPIQRLGYVRAIIELYTNLTVETAAFIDEYDLLKSSGALDDIARLLPSGDVDEFRKIVDMTQADFDRNNYETHAYISSQVEKFGNLIGTTLRPILGSIAESIEHMDDKTIEKLGRQIDKFIKKSR